MLIFLNYFFVDFKAICEISFAIPWSGNSLLALANEIHHAVSINFYYSTLKRWILKILTKKDAKVTPTLPNARIGDLDV